MPGFSKERTLIGMLLLWMIDEENSAQNRYSQRLGQLADRLNGSFPRTTEGYIKKELVGADSGSMFADAQFVHLEAIDKDGWILPLLSIKWDFATHPVEFRIRIALFMLNRTGAEQWTQAIAFRVEASEGIDSRHCYPHAQLIRKWDVGGTRFPIPGPQWLPESFPAWPLDAAEVSPMGLLIAVFVTLYGKRFIDKLVAAPFRGQLTQYFQGSRYLQQAS
jgi:hypothetical protein